MCLHLVEDRNQQFGFLVAGLRRLAVSRHRLVDGTEVGEREFGIDDLDVRNRIDFAGDMHDVVVGETAHHVHDGIGLADVGQELVAQAFAFRGARHQARDVDELDDGRNDFLRFRDRRQLRQAWIRHFDDTDVRLDGAERIVLRRDARLGQRVEQGGLAHVGQSDDSAFQ